MREKRTESLILRLTEVEKIRLISQAEEHGMSLSSYVRNKVFKGHVTSKTDIQTVIELKRVGNNLNQIAKHLNTIPDENNIKSYLQSIDEILFQISEISNKLI